MSRLLAFISFKAFKHSTSISSKMSSISEFIAFIATFSDEQKQEIQALLTEVKTETKVKDKVAKTKVAKTKVDVTYTIDCEIPLASSYRISPDDINPKLCMRRQALETYGVSRKAVCERTI